MENKLNKSNHIQGTFIYTKVMTKVMRDIIVRAPLDSGCGVIGHRAKRTKATHDTER